MPTAKYSSLPIRFLSIQIVTLVIVTGLILLLSNANYAISTLLGMGASVVSSLIYVFTLDFKPGTDPSRFFLKFTLAEGLRFIVVIILLGLTFKYLTVVPFFVMIGFIISLLTVWVFIGLQVMSELKGNR